MLFQRMFCLFENYILFVIVFCTIWAWTKNKDLPTQTRTLSEKEDTLVAR